MYLLLLNLVQVLPRFSVMLPASHHVIRASNDQNSAEHDRRPVHVLSISRYRNWEERSNGRNDHIKCRECIDCSPISAEREASRWQRFLAQTLGQDTGNAESVAEACGACEESDDGV